MKLYYTGVDANITADRFESRTPIYQSFEIADLRHLHKPRQARWRESVRAPQVGFSCAALSGALLLAAAAASLFSNQLMAPAGLALAAVPVAVVARASWSARRRPLELRAFYRGEAVCLYRTTDRLVFGQVTRALLRAIDDRSHPGYERILNADRSGRTSVSDREPAAATEQVGVSEARVTSAAA